jgi:prepilin-type processing-associated H-X9-DG protein
LGGIAPPLYDAINQSVTIVGPENSTCFATVVQTYACPSDPDAGVVETGQMGTTASYGAFPVGYQFRNVCASYWGCYGCFSQQSVMPYPNIALWAPRRAQENGCLNELSPISDASVTDGLSNTLFVVEIARAPMHELDPFFPLDYPVTGWWFIGGTSYSLVSTFYPPNAHKRVAFDAEGPRLESGSSMHSNGLNVLFGDGSVHFIKDTINSWPCDPETGIPVGASPSLSGAWSGAPKEGVWQALATRNGSEIITSDAF